MNRNKILQLSLVLIGVVMIAAPLQHISRRIMSKQIALHPVQSVQIIAAKSPVVHSKIHRVHQAADISSSKFIDSAPKDNIVKSVAKKATKSLKAFARLFVRMVK